MKRGQLTANQFITVLIVIIGFAVVLIAGMSLWEIFYTDSPDEICRISIIERATVPVETQNYIQLRCSTKKICLTLGDDCTQQFLGEKYEKIDLSRYSAAEAAQKIEEVTANAQYDCWSITGKGQFDLSSGINKDLANWVSEYFITTAEAKPACLICSRVALAPDLKNSQEIMSQVNILDYLANIKVPNSDLTYLETFTDKQITRYPSEFTNNLSTKELTQTDEIAYIFMQLWTKNSDPFAEAISAGTNTGIAIGTGAILTPAGNVAGIGLSTATALVAAASSAGLTYYNVQNNIAITNTYCGALVSARTVDGQKVGTFGCSFVAPVDYKNKTLINQFCGGGILGNL